MSDVWMQGFPNEIKKIPVLLKELGMTISQFCFNFGFKPKDAHSWMKNEEIPKGHDRTLLILISREPEAVCKALEIDITCYRK